MSRFCAGDDFVTKRFGISDSDLAMMTFKLDTAKPTPPNPAYVPSILHSMGYLHRLTKYSKYNQRKSKTEKNPNQPTRNVKSIHNRLNLITATQPKSFKTKVFKTLTVGTPLFINLDIKPSKTFF